MKLTLRQAPTSLVTTQAETLDHLRITDPSPPDLPDILRIAAGVSQELEGPQGKLQRAICTQEWSLWLDSFPARIRIPLPPLQSVTSIKYLDTDNVWRTLDPSKYRVIHGGGGDRSEIIPAIGESWPAVALTLSSVEVQFTAGYGTADDVPADIKNAALEGIALRYACRDGTAFATDRILDQLPAGQALQRYKVYS